MPKLFDLFDGPALRVPGWKSPVTMIPDKPPSASPVAVSVEAALVQANEGMRMAAGALWAAREQAREGWGDDSPVTIRLEAWLAEVNRLHQRLPGGYGAL